jgi:hypothetical protein
MALQYATKVHALVQSGNSGKNVLVIWGFARGVISSFPQQACGPRYGPRCYRSQRSPWSPFISGRFGTATPHTPIGDGHSKRYAANPLGASPPTTIMTGTTTHMMIDVGDLTRGPPMDEA